MDELDARLTQDLVAAVKDLRGASAAVSAAALRGGPPFDEARGREQEAILKVRELARRLGRSHG
jgi:hypothetical protein